MNKGKKVFSILVLLAIGPTSLLYPVQAVTYNLTVKATTRTGTWNKFYEKAVASCHMNTVISSCYGRNISNALKKGHDEAGFQYVRGHGILNADVNVYSETNGTAVYNWTNFDKIYDSIKVAGMRPIVEIGFMPPALAGSPVAGVTGSTISGVWYNGVGGNWCAPKDWNKWEALVRALVEHVETRYGQDEVRNNWFFELWNEPNWMYGGGGGLEGYKTLYNHTSVAIKAQDALVRFGGPAESGGSTACCLASFIQYCKTNNCKLDFISYHNYANDDAKEHCDATELNSFYKTNVVDVCRANQFKGLILNTEWGPSYSAGVILAHDTEIAASFAAKAIHLLNSNDTTAYPPPYSFAWWTISDIYEEIDNKDASPAFSGCYGLLTRGVPDIPQSWDVAKPAFNVFKLLHRLKDYKISCSGGAISSPGLNVVGTISAANDSIAILTYSHTDNTSGNSSTVDNVTLNVTMPTGWTNAKMEHWVVDRTHSNSYQAWVGLGSPKNPTATQWTTIANAAQLAHYDSIATVAITNGTCSKSFTQNYYSVGLILLTNPGASGISAPESAPSVRSIAAVDWAVLRAGTITFSPPSAGVYIVRLISTDGRVTFQKQVNETGSVRIASGHIAAGAYLMECAGASGRQVKPVVIGR
jgi:xylan 1,4-beta-xylosidase